MKYFKLTIFILGLLFISCNQTDNKTTLATEEQSSGSTDDKEQLQKLIRQFYEWHETKSSKKDFNPIADQHNSIYVGLDLNQLDLRLKELKATNYFADQFLDNYNKIALTIDERLKNKKLEWVVGELPPFGNDANPWCNCQDNPDNYWQTMIINKITFDNKAATFTWTWGDNFEYNVKAIKENGNWKISYLQGFDFDDFTTFDGNK